MTEAWATFDTHALYIAVRCAEPLMNRIKLDTLAEEQKAPVWNDDSVEVFLDLGNSGMAIQHFVVNANGTYYDSQIVQMREVPSAWESNARVRTSRSADRWEIEIAFPWDSLPHRLEKGEVFSLNVGRNRHAEGALQIASLAEGHYAFPQHFKRVLMQSPLQVGGYQLLSTRRGPFFESEGGAWEFELLQHGAAPFQVVLKFPDSKEMLSLRPEERFFSIPFSKGQAARFRSLSLATAAVPDAPLYESKYELQAKEIPARVATTSEPVFEGLLEPNPGGLAKGGVLMWPHEILRPLMANLPFRTAFVADSEAPYRQYGRDHAILFMMGATLDAERLERLDRHGVPVAYCVDARRGLPAEVPVHPKYRQPWLLDPRAIESYLADARRAIELAKSHPSIRYLAAGDETWEVMHRNLLRMLDEKENYPELAKADAEIREKYGFGKYGLPKSSSDTDPYCWIATYRWEVDRMIAVQREIREMIRKEVPYLKMISWDNVDGMRPYGISRWPEVFDILLHQLYPSSNPRREEFGAQTRFYSDLGSGAENWPIPHIEHYAGSFTPKEVEEFYSQCLRNGATGFGLYMADTVAERAGKGSPVVDRIGAPERWRVTESLVQRLVKEPFRVKTPTADTAIFYSNPSVQASGTGEGHALQFRAHNHGEWLYTILGPRLRSSLAFVDEWIVTSRMERLKAFKVVYLPYIPIADDAEYEALESFVRAGGQLVICDPLAFSHRSDGTVRNEGVLLPPGPMEGSAEPKEMIHEGRRIPSFGQAHPLRATGGERVLAEYQPGGGAAVVERKVGQGRILFLAENPLRSRVIDDAGWIQLFGAFQKMAGAESDNPIWRFRLPSPATPEKTERFQCLTGNAIQWRGSEPRLAGNAKVKGWYELSVDDSDGKEKGGQPISFEVGRLTDRLRAAKASNEAPREDFTLHWQNANALEIKYGFAEPVTVHEVCVFYAKGLAAGTLEVSSDGMGWKPLAQWEEHRLGDSNEVACLTLPVSQSPGAVHYRLQFQEVRDMQLIETELWGKE